VNVDVGPEARDIYDAASNQLIQKDVCGLAHFIVPADTARVIVLAPAGGEMRNDGKRTLINNVVVRWAE
jgi:hypothetical protein